MLFGTGRDNISQLLLFLVLAGGLGKGTGFGRGDDIGTLLLFLLLAGGIGHH